MEEFTQETVTTRQNNSDRSTSVSSENNATGYQTFEYLIYFFFGLVSVLLAFRFVLKLAGASMGSTFVSWIYGATQLFIWPFAGIFRRGFASGAETTSVFEPSTLIALVVYAILAWGIVKLLRILSGKQQTN